MTTAVIGTGHIGATLGTAFAKAGIPTVFGSRHPDDTKSGVTTIKDALTGADTVVLALPGPAVEDFLSANGTALAGMLVIDAANSGGPIPNHAAAVATHAPQARYARAFNTLGVENLADPDFDGTPADMFFSCAEQDRATLEQLITAVGLRPMYLGDKQEDLVDSVLRLWFALAMGQQHGRNLAFRTLTRA